MFLLEDILESNHKSVVLAFFLLSPERAFSVRELSKKLHINAPILNSVLREFTKYSFTLAFARDNQDLYIVNPKHKMLPEIKLSLTKNQKRIDDDFSIAITKLGEIQGAFLSGVFTGQPKLPVDLLLVGKINLTKLDTFLQTSKKTMGIDINYSIMSPDEFLMRRDTFDRFLKDIFDYRHLVIIDNTRSHIKKHKVAKK